MSITSHLQSHDMSLKIIPEPSDATFSCFNDAGVEIEVGEFLYGFIRMMKPVNVFETGTHVGVSASYIAQALKDNGKGLLTTVEINRDFINKAEARWNRLQVKDYVVVDRCRSFDYKPEYEMDVIFLDSEPEYRFQELIKFYPFLKAGGYVFIHDLHRSMHQIENEEHGFAWPYGELPQQIINWVKAGELRPIHFPTPRGLTCFYKVSKDDYVW